MCIFGVVRVGKRQRELERLAWAGGFFDGEGSTFARSESARPGYRRLNVVAPQLGGASIPEVLARFRIAMNEMGSIGRPSSGLYQWRVLDYARSRAAVALLWPWIGAVKRKQAAAALAIVARQYESGAIRGRPWRRRATLIAVRVDKSSLDREARTRLDRAWAAGFLDAEGCFGLARAKDRVGGSRWYRVRASASQHGEVGQPAAVLERLRRVVGTGRIERHGEPDDFRWVAEGILELERVLEAVGPWLGTVKRGQAGVAMSAFTNQTRRKGDGVHCLRGHRYDRRVVLVSGRTRVHCNTCSRLRDRRTRAAQGILPRQFKNVARRYTD